MPAAPGTSRVVLNADDIARTLDRLAHEINLAARKHNTHSLALIGVRRGGVPIARRLRALLAQSFSQDVPLGTVDITLYRDDAATALPNPLIGRSEIDFSIADHTIVLVDDVLFTGRTTRAAIDAILDYGRPRAIQLATLIDRGHRELPIQADFTGEHITTAFTERVDVYLEREGGLPDEVIVFSP